MSTQAAVAILISSVPFFFLAFGRLLLPQENRFAVWLRPLFSFFALFSLTFVYNAAWYFAEVEGMVELSEAMMNMLLQSEYLLYFLIAMYGLSLLWDVVEYMQNALRRKHG